MSTLFNPLMVDDAKNLDPRHPDMIGNLPNFWSFWAGVQGEKRKQKVSSQLMSPHQVQ